jgi:ElaB/YqjD/DUF883 family membrane-anchored ribosome-binding protein
MNDKKSVSDKVEALSSGLSDTVHDLMREAKPALHRAADRMTDRVNELAQQGVHVACQGQRELEDAGHDLASHAEHMIRHEPFKAMLVAAGVGAAVVAVIGLLARPHPHHRAH